MRRPWLAPLVPLYAAGAAMRARMQTQRKLRWPVVSVGNLSTGGAGKTPFTIALARLLTERGFAVDVLSRGYGRSSSLAAKVEADGRAEQFGDEPLLIARTTGLPVFVAAQRYDAGVLAEGISPEQGGASLGQNVRVHLLDDGFQHRQLKRDVDILLLNREDWGDALLPAGNLREALRAARRADVIVIPADDAELESELRAWGWQGHVWRVRRRMEVPAMDGPVLAFCGIARPEQFFAGLKAAGVTVAARKAFPDHYDYTAQVMEWLAQQARSVGVTALLTTEKDAVRMGDLAAKLPLKTVGLSIEICDEAAAMDWLSARLHEVSAQKPV